MQKTTEQIEMPFGMWTRVGPRKHVLDGVQIPTLEGAFLRGWSAQDMSGGRYIQSDVAGASTDMVHMLIGVY